MERSIILALCLVVGTSAFAVDKPKSMMEAVMRASFDEVKAAVAAGADIEQRDQSGNTPLMLATLGIGNDADIVAFLLKKGASLEAVDNNKCTALCHAAKNHSFATARLLLEAKANPNVSDQQGNTPLMLAVSPYDRAELVQMLLEYGADINATNSVRETALNNAAISNSTTTLKVLIDAKADINIPDLINYTPLHSAALADRTETVRFLLQAGADPYLKDVNNHSAFDHATGKSAWLLRQWQNNGGKLPPSEKPAPPPPPKDELKRMVAEAVKEASDAKAPTLAPISDIDKPSFHLKEHPDDWAVVVGIDKYSDLPAAQFAERDAQAVTDHLLAMGFPSRNVVLLSGEKAGYKGIEKFVENWLPRNVTENSRVVFYFSGHGAPDIKTGLAYLVSWDGDANFLENTGYPIKRLYEKLGALKAKKVLVALDACFSGAGGRSVLAKGARPLVSKVDTGPAPSEKLTVFSAASGEQITSTLESQGHGTFTYYFLKGLEGDAKDSSGVVTARGLYQYLKPKVQDAARRQNRDQEPGLQAPAQDAEIVRF